LLLPALPAEAGGKQELTYEVYAGGIHAVQAHLTIDLTQKGRYSIILDAETRGFLHTFVPWEGRFESHGWLKKDGRFQPELHKSTAIWRGEEEIKEYHYKKDGSFIDLLETVDGKKELQPKEIDPALTKGTTDVFSAALHVFAAIAAGQDCAGEDDIFDGKRRFLQRFAHEDFEVLEPTKYNIFKGVAARCTVEVVPDGGEWSKKPRGWLSIQEQGRERGTMPTLWIAALHAKDPAVPVKIRVKTAYGTLFMHLGAYRDETRSLSASKRP
jgi:hypothetical protein